uniref:C3H1-type domain-containing protein n=1 Tax=Peronospora matthiolae TaxID=2874970 RepID=A0AAV1UE39_9STRA
MHRNQVATTPTTGTPVQTEKRSQLAKMSQHSFQPLHASAKPPSPPAATHHQVPFVQPPARPSGGSHRHNYSTSSKPKKPRQSPALCTKFMSGYGCSYGNKCRFSHDLRAIYPVYYDFAGYDDPAWSTAYAMPQSAHQNYLQRQVLDSMNPSWVPEIDPTPFRVPSPQRERAASFANHFESCDNQFSGAPAYRRLPLKEAVPNQSKAQQPESKHHASAPHKSTGGNGCGDESSVSKRQGKATPESESADMSLARQRLRRKKILRPRKCAPSDGVTDPADGDTRAYHRNPNYLSGEVGSADTAGAERAQHETHRHDQVNRRYPARATQLMHPRIPSYTRYFFEEQFYSNISRQIEGFVDYIDRVLSLIEPHQQQVINSLQNLVRSLWPDALIDVYGSSYTRLALPVSDIDCVLLSSSLVEEKALMILETLAADVERQPWSKKLKLLESAKIPVLKMTNSLDPTQPDVQLDLTCGHSVGHTGLNARDLIYSLQAEMPALRPLVLVLKSHLVSNDLNCAFTGGISSYVLVILVVRFLQACGDVHHKSFVGSSSRNIRGGNRRRSNSESAPAHDMSEESAYISSLGDPVVHPKWCFTFSRGGRVTWRTGISSLLLLFLETYTTFDYRRFGISIDDKGEFFLLPPEKVAPLQCSVVIPYVADPIKPGRSICNCFRMHEVIQSWLALYQNLVAGVPVATCVGRHPAP